MTTATETTTAVELITVTVAPIPGKPRQVKLQPNSTVGDAVRAAEFAVDGFEFRIKSEIVTLNSPVKDGQTVMLLKPVKGN